MSRNTWKRCLESIQLQQPRVRGITHIIAPRLAHVPAIAQSAITHLWCVLGEISCVSNRPGRCPCNYPHLSNDKCSRVGYFWASPVPYALTAIAVICREAATDVSRRRLKRKRKEPTVKTPPRTEPGTGDTNRKVSPVPGSMIFFPHLPWVHSLRSVTPRLSPAAASRHVHRLRGYGECPLSNFIKCG